jgi:uncharacterized membrane protein YagU involved in acid resistance
LTEIIFIGIIAGLISTGMMTIFEIPFWKLLGIQGILEWHENQILVLKVLKKFKRREHDTVCYIGILLLHIINGTVASIVFPFVNLFFTSLFSQNEIRLSIIFGMAYGILLWTLTLLPIHKPITGLPIWNHPLGKRPAIISIFGHIIYGITLGTITSILLL